MLVAGDASWASEWAGWVPFFRSVAWIALIVGVLTWQRQPLKDLLEGAAKHVKAGRFSILWRGIKVEFRELSRGAKRIKPSGSDAEVDEPSGGDAEVDEPAALEQLRRRQGEDQRGVHLVHVLRPSEEPEQEYDIFVYLAGWHRERFGDPSDLSDVAKAEFWLGPKFTPAGVTVQNQADQGVRRIGFTTAAYGPVLCVCKVTFTDGQSTTLSRYLDFESGDLLHRAMDDDEVSD